MKKIYALFAILFATVMMNAQQLLTIVQTSPGIYTVTYNDAANGWAFYNPNSQPIGMNLWINAGENSTNTAFTDNWAALTTQLTWDGTNYSGTINLPTHAFSQGTLPSVVTVNQLNFNFTEFPAGNSSHQTANLQGTAYGFTPYSPTTLGTLEALNKSRTFVNSGLLYTGAKGDLALEIYTFGGALVSAKTVKSNGSPIVLGNLSEGNYILKIAGKNNTEVIKFRK